MEILIGKPKNFGQERLGREPRPRPLLMSLYIK